MSLGCPPNVLSGPPKSCKYENHIEVLRHLDVFRSWGGAVWDSNVFSKSVTYWPTLSKFRGGPVKKNHPVWYDDRVVWQQTRKKRTCLVLYFFESDVSADDMTDRGSGDQIRANPLFIKSLQKNLVLLLLARPQFRFSGPISLLVILTLSFLSQRVTS